MNLYLIKMNQYKNTIRRIVSLLKLPSAFLLLLATVNCTSGDNSDCITTNTDFSQLYAAAVAQPGHSDTSGFESEIHEYTFTISETKTICSVGYQSQPAIADVPYLIKIINNNTNTVLYSASHVFSSTNTSYVSITPTVVKAGDSYTIRRTLLLSNVGNLQANLAGRVVTDNGAVETFPKAFGLMTITGSHFYHNGVNNVDTGIPFIDISYY